MIQGTLYICFNYHNWHGNMWVRLFDKLRRYHIFHWRDMAWNYTKPIHIMRQTHSCEECGIKTDPCEVSVVLGSFIPHKSRLSSYHSKCAVYSLTMKGGFKEETEQKNKANLRNWGLQLPSNPTQIGFISSIFQPVWPSNLMDDLEKQ